MGSSEKIASQYLRRNYFPKRFNISLFLYYLAIALIQHLRRTMAHVRGGLSGVLVFCEVVRSIAMSQTIFRPRAEVDGFDECLKFPTVVSNDFPLPIGRPVKLKPFDKIWLHRDDPPLVVLCYLSWQVNMPPRKVDMVPLQKFCLVWTDASEHTYGKPWYEIPGLDGYLLYSKASDRNRSKTFVSSVG